MGECVRWVGFKRWTTPRRKDSAPTAHRPPLWSGFLFGHTVWNLRSGHARWIIGFGSYDVTRYDQTVWVIPYGPCGIIRSVFIIRYGSYGAIPSHGMCHTESYGVNHAVWMMRYGYYGKYPAGSCGMDRAVWGTWGGSHGGILGYGSYAKEWITWCGSHGMVRTVRNRRTGSQGSQTC